MGLPAKNWSGLRSRETEKERERDRGTHREKRREKKRREVKREDREEGRERRTIKTIKTENTFFFFNQFQTVTEMAFYYKSAFTPYVLIISIV